MMDNRNGYGSQRIPSGGMRAGSADVPGSRPGHPAKTRGPAVPAGGGRWPEGTEPGGRFLAYEPEDYDGGPVPIADPPVPDGEGAGVAGGAGGTGENAPDTCGSPGALAGYPLAMAYTPDQIWQELYEDDEALAQGTLFRELDFPFCPGCRKSGR